MVKKLLWLAILLPTFANAQFNPGVNVNASSIQKNSISGWVRWLQGTNEVRLATYADLPTVTPVSFTAFGSTPNANGASVTSNVITLQPADATNPGGVTIGPQTFKGYKTFEANGSNFALRATTANSVAIQADNNSASSPALSAVNNGAGNIVVFGNTSMNHTSLSNAGILTVPNLLLSGLTASTSLQLDGSKNAISVANTGTGSNVLAVSPAFTGTPTAPTATGGTNTTQLATTAFVTAAVSGVAGIPITGAQSGITGAKTGTWTIETGGAIGGAALKGTTSTGSGVYGVATGSSGSAVLAQATGNGKGLVASTGDNIAGDFQNASTTIASQTVTNTSSGPLATFSNSGGVKSSIVNNGGFNWVGATASTSAVFDGSKNLVSNTNTGTGNSVLATSPTLVTPILTGNVTVNADGSGNQLTLARSGAIALFFMGGTTAPATVLNLVAGGSGGVSLSTGATSWAAISDWNSKTAFKPFTNALEKVVTLRAGTGRYKVDEKNVSRSFLVAQDVQKVLPEAVSISESGELSLRYSDVIPLLVGAIKELEARIKVLENK